MSGPDPEPPDSALVEGARLLGRGRWREAHEVFEAAWRSGHPGPPRTLFHALAQLGAAMLKWSEGKLAPAATLLGRARQRIGGLPSRVENCQVDALEEQLLGLAERLAQGEPAPDGLSLGLGGNRAASSDATPIELECPYCGEPVTVQAEPTGLRAEQYVEDCPVCCRPWTVEVVRDDGGVSIALGREDD